MCSSLLQVSSLSTSHEHLVSSSRSPNVFLSWDSYAVSWFFKIFIRLFGQLVIVWRLLKTSVFLSNYFKTLCKRLPTRSMGSVLYRKEHSSKKMPNKPAVNEAIQIWAFCENQTRTEGPRVLRWHLSRVFHESVTCAICVHSRSTRRCRCVSAARLPARSPYGRIFHSVRFVGYTGDWQAIFRGTRLSGLTQVPRSFQNVSIFF